MPVVSPRESLDMRRRETLGRAGRCRTASAAHSEARRRCGVGNTAQGQMSICSRPRHALRSARRGCVRGGVGRVGVRHGARRPCCPLLGKGVGGSPAGGKAVSMTAWLAVEAPGDRLTIGCTGGESQPHAATVPPTQIILASTKGTGYGARIEARPPWNWSPPAA